MKLKKLQRCISFFICIGISAGFMFQSSAATPAYEDMDNSVIYIRNLTEQPIDSIRNAQFIESRNKSVVSVVDKAVLDETEPSERVNLVYQMREDLSQKRTIMFYGDQTNLSLEQMAELLEIEDIPSIEYADDIAINNLNYLQAVYFQEKEDGSHVVGHIYDFTSTSADEKLASAIKSCVHMASIEVPIEENTADISLQLRNTISNTGNPKEKSDSYQWDEAYVERSIKAIRKEVGDSETAWEVTEMLHITPNNANGWQTRQVLVDIIAGNDVNNINNADERLVEYMPKVSVNNNSNSFSISSTLTKNFINVGISSSHSYSYSDIECYPVYKPEGQEYCAWEFLYRPNSPGSKFSSSHYPIVHMRNKLDRFRFMVNDTMLFTEGNAQTGNLRITGRVVLKYSDLVGGKF